MADVSESLRSVLDSAHPSEPEDYTEWVLDAATIARLDQYAASDVNTPEDWDLKGGGS